MLTRRGSTVPFEVHLAQFDGPFDLLLGLIGKHRLDLTEIALATVTDDFLAHLRAQQTRGADWDLSQTTQFLLVAATLLDLKAARLLPRADAQEEDLEVIEARDLLFARLLQYRAFKEVAGVFAQRMDTVGRVVPRQAGLDPRFAGLLPQLVLGVDPDRFARIAALAMVPRLPPTVGLAHLHAPEVSLREQTTAVTALLRACGTATFAELSATAESALVVVTRFLVVLELFRDAAVTFEQPEALGTLTIRWCGEEASEEAVAARLENEYDAVATGRGGAASSERIDR